MVRSKRCVLWIKFFALLCLLYMPANQASADWSQSLTAQISFVGGPDVTYGKALARVSGLYPGHELYVGTAVYFEGSQLPPVETLLPFVGSEFIWSQFQFPYNITSGKSEVEVSVPGATYALVAEVDAFGKVVGTGYYSLNDYGYKMPTNGATRGGIELTVYTDERKTQTTTAMYIEVSDAAKDIWNGRLTYGKDYVLEVTDRSYRITGLPRGSYSLKITDGLNELIVPVQVQGGKMVAKNVVFAQSLQSLAVKTSYGSVSGFVYGTDGHNSFTRVRLIGKEGTWETSSRPINGDLSGKGYFRFIVPAGDYQIVTLGSKLPYSNIDRYSLSGKIKVQPNQDASLLEDIHPTSWDYGEWSSTYTLRFDDVYPGAITGTAAPGDAIIAYAGSAGETSATVKGKAGSSGAFRLWLPTYRPGQMVEIFAYDALGNETYIGGQSNVPLDFALFADTTDNFANKKIELPVIDKGGGFFAQSIQSVAYMSDDSPYGPTVLRKGIEYTVAKDKITINAGVLPVGNSTIHVRASGYNDAEVQQTIKKSGRK